jgi:GNAT superfamily N-acetyltransferase
MSMDRLVTTTYLEMTSRARLRPAAPGKTVPTLVRAEIPCPAFNRFLYAAVGARWWWYARLSWSHARWLAYLDRPELHTWVAYVSGSPAGYFELERQDGGNVEIAYLGLLPEFVGAGLGGPLLTAAITRAWDMGASRVWVHTCDLDHPAALPNYQARGLTIYRVEQAVEALPDAPLEPWPGAGMTASP